MHAGPAIKKSGDWFSNTVNVAARVLAFAGPGDVVLTEATFRVARDLKDVEFDRLGARSHLRTSVPTAGGRKVVGSCRKAYSLNAPCVAARDESDLVGFTATQGNPSRPARTACLP